MKHENRKFEESFASKGSSYSSDSCITLILTLLCFVIIVTHFVASFFPKGRIWGINQWAYFPSYLTFSVTSLALLFFLPTFNRFVLNTMKALISPVFRYMEKKRYLWYLIFSLLFFCLFWVLRTKTYFLGDGYQILANIESTELSIKWTEPLESLLHLQAFNLFKSLLHLKPETLYAVFSCMAGSIFIFLCFLFADFLGKERFQLKIPPLAGKILVFLILISMGSIELFFGYVEHYTFLFLSVFGFLFLSLAYLVENPAFDGERNPKHSSRMKLIFPLLTFILAFLFHVSALYLLPAVFFLSVPRDQNSRFYKIKRVLLGIFALVLVVILFFGYKKYSWMIPSYFVPLTHDRYFTPGYTLFSTPHLLDLLNQQLLVSPVGLILILVLLICKKGRAFLTSRSAQFLLIVALSQFIFNFLLDPGLGASRDWDMFSAVGLGYTILGLYLLLKSFQDKIKFEYLSVILVVTSLYSTIPWIALNSCKPKTIQRFRDLLLIDPKKSANGHFVLVRYFDTLGQKEEIEKENQVQREGLPELVLIADGKKLLVEGKFDSAEAKLLMAKEIAPQFGAIHDNLGMAYFGQKELDKAEIEYKEAIRLAPLMSSPYFNLANLHVVKGDMDSAFELYKRAVFLKCQFPDAYYNLGRIYFMRGDLKKAEDFFKKALKLKSDFEDAYMGLGDIYKEKKEFQKAIKMYQTVIQLKPGAANAYLQLGMTYLFIRSKEDAIRELEKFLELAPQSKNADQVRNILQQLRP